jgi:glycosyltransferase involved in cell wall biosynthesis
VRVAVHVDQVWFSAPGGIGTYVRELVPELAAAGADLTLFRSEWPAPGPDWLEAYPAAVVPGRIRTLYPRWDLTGRPPLPPSLSGQDIVHATNHAAVPPVPGGRRLVVTVHDLAFERFPELFPRRWRWLYGAGLRAAAARAHAIVVPSQATADDLGRRGDVDPARVHVTPLAASLAAGAGDPGPTIDRLGIPRPYLLSVGTQEPRKNLPRLVRAYRRAGPPHALVLAGQPGWRSDELEREVAAGGPGRIVRTGTLDAADLDAVYRGADAFAYPSLYEGFGLPVLEAMARGVPVVTSNASSIPEVAGDAAVLVDPEDEAALAGALTRVLGDEALRADLGRRGRERAAGFSWAATARATLAAYRFAEEVAG